MDWVEGADATREFAEGDLQQSIFDLSVGEGDESGVARFRKERESSASGLESALRGGAIIDGDVRGEGSISRK